MAPSIGLNLRVTGYKHQGGRRYMEDDFGVAYQQTADEKDLEYAFFGIFDGHGGREAAAFAKEHLMDYIVSQKGFWEDSDESVLKAIREGYIQTHYAMWKELEKWPKTASGLPSTAGTTASIAFIRRGKIYVGHVGDSAIVLGVQDPDNPDVWIADPLTIDHKPESLEESTRIIQSGGKVVCKSGVPRVVWNRPKMGHQGPVRRSTHIDEIPFLAVARSLGDLWSYNSEENVFVVSPEPDCRVYPVDITKHRCLILATDGAWNMMTPQNSVSVVCKAEKSNEQHMLNPVEGRTCWINPSKMLVDTAIERWINSKLRADNTSVVTVMLDPPGPPRAQVLKNRQRELAELNSGRDVAGPSGIQQATSADRGSMALVTNTTAADGGSLSAAAAVAANIEPCVAGPSGAWPSQQPQRPLSAVSDMEPVPGPSSSSLSASSSHPKPTVATPLVPVAGSSGAALAATGTVPVPGPDSQPGEPQQPSDTCTIISSNPSYSAGYDLFKHRKLQQDIVPDNSQDDSAAVGVPVPPTRTTSSAQPAAGQSPSAVRVPGTPPLPRVGGSLRDDTIILTRPSPVAAAQASSPTNNRGAPAKPEDIVQCNEISSSEDSPGHTKGDRDGNSTPPPPPGQENILPTSSSSKVTPVDAEGSKKSRKSNSTRPTVRKSLSRELNMLQAEVGRSRRSAKTSPRKAVVPSAAAASPKSAPRGVASGRVAKLSISTSVTTVSSRTRTSTATYKTSPTASKTPTAAKRLAKPKLSEQKTKSLVQMRCVEIIEKLEMAKSVSTRSLSVKSLNRVDSRSSRQQAVSESPALKKANMPKASSHEPPPVAVQEPKTTAVKAPKTPAVKASPVTKSKTPSKPSTPVATAKAPVPKNTTPVSKSKTPATSKAPKTPVRSTRKTRVAPASTPKGAKAAPANTKAKTPLGLRTPKTIMKNKKVAATPARSTKKVREIVEKLTAASNKDSTTPKGKKAAVSTPAKLIATTRKLTIAATPKLSAKAKAATPRAVAKSPKPPTPKSVPKTTPKSSKRIVTSNAKSSPMISRSGSSSNSKTVASTKTSVTPKISPAKKVTANPKSAIKSAKIVTVATPKSSLKRKRTADATENVPEEKTMQPPTAKTPRRTAAVDVKTPHSAKSSNSKTPKSTKTKTPKKSAIAKTPTKSTTSKTPSKTGGKTADTKTPRGAGKSADVKSPRKVSKTPQVVVNKKPLITRSRKATVLKLKKK